VTSGDPESAAPVPGTVLARTSTLVRQDPLASLQRQFRSFREWLPEGWYVARDYWDVESGFSRATGRDATVIRRRAPGP
jgi:hypothetical protein